MNCITSKIGIKGLCADTEERSVWLDNYGISLSSVAKITPKSIANGKALLDSIINDATKDTLRDIRFDGMVIGETLHSCTIGTANDTTLPEVAEVEEIEFSTNCETTSFYIGQIRILGNGETIVKINDEEVFNGAVVGKHDLRLNRVITDKSFTISIDRTDFIAQSTNLSDTYSYGDYYSVSSSEGYGLIPSVSIRCDLTNYFCQYADLIADVVKFKVLANIYHTLLYSDRMNEYILFKDTDKLYELMSFYDSTYNVGALNGDVKAVPKGQYQIAKEQLFIPEPKCTCCKKRCVEPITFKIGTP